MFLRMRANIPQQLRAFKPMCARPHSHCRSIIQQTSHFVEMLPCVSLQIFVLPSAASVVPPPRGQRLIVLCHLTRRRLRCMFISRRTRSSTSALTKALHSSPSQRHRQFRCVAFNIPRVVAEVISRQRTTERMEQSRAYDARFVGARVKSDVFSRLGPSLRIANGSILRR